MHFFGLIESGKRRYRKRQTTLSIAANEAKKKQAGTVRSYLLPYHFSFNVDFADLWSGSREFICSNAK